MTRIRRLTIGLPPRLQATAAADARAIAEAIAARLGPDAAKRMTVSVAGQRATGAALAQQVAARIAPGGKGRS